MSKGLDTLYLINSASNEGRAMAQWRQARTRYAELPENPADLQKINDLGTFLKQRKPKVIVMAGGDGSVNSVCGIVHNWKRKPLIAILPFGFGNVLSLCFGVETLDKAMAVLRNRKERVKIDLIRTSLSDFPVGVFNIGVGYDARIVHSRMQHRYIGLRSYVMATFRAWWEHRPREISFRVDGGLPMRATTASLMVANCPVVGGNYVVSSSARMNDGFLDCTLFSNKYAYLTNARFKGFQHPLYSNHGKVRFKAKRLVIEGEPYVQVDGDPVYEKRRVELEILPEAVTFLKNSDDQIDQMYLPFIES